MKLKQKSHESVSNMMWSKIKWGEGGKSSETARNGLLDLLYTIAQNSCAKFERVIKGTKVIAVIKRM